MYWDATLELDVFHDEEEDDDEEEVDEDEELDNLSSGQFISLWRWCE